MRLISSAGFQFEPLSQLPSPLPTALIASISSSLGCSTPSPVTVISSVAGSNVIVTSQSFVTLNDTLLPLSPYAVSQLWFLTTLKSTSF